MSSRETLKWLTDVAEARKEARRLHRPLLIDIWDPN